MSMAAISRSIPPAVSRWSAALILTLAMVPLATPSAQAQDANKVLKAMSDYVTSQNTISLAFDSDIEVITSELQKIQFASSGQVLLVRPDKIRATRTGGYADVELVFDGKTVTVLGKNISGLSRSTHRAATRRAQRRDARRRPAAIAGLRRADG
jgi:hypothetical protein